MGNGALTPRAAGIRQADCRVRNIGSLNGAKKWVWTNSDGTPRREKETATMGYDLLGRNNNFFVNVQDWRPLLNIAVQFGWEPQGTESPADCPPEWDGDYVSNAFQFVSDSDACAFGKALLRAAREIKKSGSAEILSKYMGGPNLDTVVQVAKFAMRSGFLIG